MKKTLYLLLFLAIASAAEAQIESDSASQKDEKKYDNRFRGQAQEKWDAGAKKVMEGLLNRGGETKYEDNYSFDVAIIYHINVFKKNGKKKDDSQMEFLINKDNNIIAMIPVENGKKQESMIVYDAQNKSVLTLISDKDNNKTGMAMKYDPSEVEINEENDISFEKTDERKDILGYSCQKYLAIDDDAETEYWITDEVDLNMRDVFGVMDHGKSKNYDFGDDYPKGMMMESTTTEKNGTSTTMKIVKLELDSDKEISTEGYQMMNLGSMMRD